MIADNAATTHPLTPMQEAMLFQTVSSPTSSIYLEQTTWTMRGEFREEAFTEAWQALVNEHEMLRTRFFWNKGDAPCQEVIAGVKVICRFVDLSECAGEELPERLKAIARIERECGVDLETPPLMNWIVVKIHQHERHVIWTHHHIVMDGWCAPMLLEEFWTRYLSGDGKAVDGAKRAKYTEYIDWLSRRCNADEERFWRGVLQGATLTPLGIDGSYKLPSGVEDDCCAAFQLSLEVTKQLKNVARRNRVTLNLLIQAAWALLLSHYSRRSDIMFGMPVAGRPLEIEGIGSVVGLFINILPVRCKVDPCRRLFDWLADLQHDQLELLENQYTPLAEIAQWADFPPRSQLFESVLVFGNLVTAPRASKAASVAGVSNFQHRGATTYPITVEVVATDVLSMRVLFKRSRIKPETADMVLRHLTRVLDHFAQGTNCKLSSIQLNPKPARPCFGTVADSELRGDLVTVFEETAIACGRRLAVVQPGGRSLTFEELNTYANLLGRHLSALGVGREDRVAVSFDRVASAWIAVLAILKCGGMYVPIDSEYPTDRRAFMIRDSGCKLLLTGGDLAGAWDWCDIPVLEIPSPMFHDEPSSDNPGTQISPLNGAYIIYTSGSTGRPKGVIGTHGGTLNRFRWMWQKYPFANAELCCYRSAPGFVDSVWDMLGALLAGIPTLALSKATCADLRDLTETLAAHKVTRIVVLPSLLATLLDYMIENGIKLPALEYWTSSGEPLPQTLVQRFYQWLPDRILLNLGGATELSSDSICFEMRSTPETCFDITPLGTPIANTRACVVDFFTHMADVGCPGELTFSGAALARGYYGSPSLTAERFVPDAFPAVPGSRVFRTGDLARVASEGYVEYLGRLDNRVKLRGFRIEPHEIEVRLASHPSIQHCAVVCRQFSSEPRLVAHIVVRSGCTLTSEVVREHLAVSLPDYMIPSIISILGELPRTAHGKIDRQALAAMPISCEEHQYSPAQTRTEQRLINILRQLLKVEEIGRTDDFFAAGGNSLQGMRLIAKIRKEFGRDLPASILLKHATAQSLAQLIDDERHTSENLLLTIREAAVPATTLFCIHPGNGNVLCYRALANRLPEDCHVYGIRARGVDGREPPLSDLKAMASLYMDLILATQTCGPYSLAGWCLGGTIAYEIACQLQRAGETVDLLVMIDAGGAPLGDDAEDDVDFLTRFFGGRIPQEFSPDEMRAMGHSLVLTDQQLAYMLAHLVSAGLVPPDLDLWNLRLALNLRRAHSTAEATYRPGPYCGRVVFFQPSEKYVDHPNPLPHWQSLISPRLDWIEVEGNHNSIVGEAASDVMAGYLATILKP